MITDQIEIDRKKGQIICLELFCSNIMLHLPPTNQEAVSDTQTTKKKIYFGDNKYMDCSGFVNFYLSKG